MLKLRGVKLEKRLQMKSKLVPHPGTQKPTTIQNSIAGDLALAIETQDLIDCIKNITSEDAVNQGALNQIQNS